MIVFGGSGSRRLSADICTYLDMELGQSEVLQFSEGNLFVRLLENVRGRAVYVVQSTGYPANDNLVELLFWIDACKRASAASVTVVMPYFSYAKGDKKDEPRVSIRGRVCADAIEAAGADRIVTMDLHAAQVQGFFRVPVDDLYALPVLCAAVQEDREDMVVVAPDTGFAKKGRQYASYLGVGLVIGDKERQAHDERAKILEIIGDVRGKSALIVDDVAISGGTLVDMADKLVAEGAREVQVLITHGAFSGQAMERIQDSPIERLLVTDTIETQPVTLGDKIEVVSVAPLFGEAIRRIHQRQSISSLFPN